MPRYLLFFAHELVDFRLAVSDIDKAKDSFIVRNIDRSRNCLVWQRCSVFVKRCQSKENPKRCVCVCACV